MCILALQHSPQKKDNKFDLKQRELIHYRLKVTLLIKLIWNIGTRAKVPEQFTDKPQV